MHKNHATFVKFYQFDNVFSMLTCALIKQQQLLNNSSLFMHGTVHIKMNFSVRDDKCHYHNVSTTATIQKNLIL